MYMYYQKAVHLYFLIDLLIRLITAKHPKNFVLSAFFAIEVVTIVPFLCIGLTAKDIHLNGGDPVRFCMMLDTLRLVLCKRILDMPGEDLADSRETINYLLILVTSAVFPSAMVTYLETIGTYPEMFNEGGTQLGFWWQMYFILYTCSVVGYGASLQN